MPLPGARGGGGGGGSQLGLLTSDRGDDHHEG